MGSTALEQPASRESTLGLLRRVVSCFDVGEVVEVEELSAGLMNRNWRVRTATGSFALKQVLDITAGKALCQHGITRALAADGFPVPAPLQDRDGSTLVAADGGHYMLLPWVDGQHLKGEELTLDSCRLLGELLAEIHTWLGTNAAKVGLEPSPVSREVSATTPDEAAATIGRFLGLASSRPVSDEFDRMVQARLGERQELLSQNAALCPGTCRVSPIGWTHGDFHALNIIWSPGSAGQVAAVVDWDRIRSQPLGWELARSATLLFSYDQGDSTWALDLNRISAFAAGYRNVNPLTDGQVAESVYLLWWSRLCDDFWQLERHYDHADTSADHLFLSASGLLAWWSSYRKEVTTAFTRLRQS